MQDSECVHGRELDMMNAGKVFVRTNEVWKQKVSEFAKMMRKKHSECEKVN